MNMKLKYFQKIYIQKNYNFLNLEKIAKDISVPEAIVRRYVDENQILFKNKVTAISTADEGNKKNLYMYLIIPILFVLIVYANSLSAQFVSDDVYAISRNEKAMKKIGYFIIEPIMFIRSIQFYFAYHVLGLVPWAFRIFNILFHIGFVCMTYLIVPYFSKKKYLPFFVATLAAVHPMMVESVTWISGGIYAQSGFFLFLSFYIYLKYRQNFHLKPFLLSLFLFICALSSSEKVIIFPFIILLYEFTFGSIAKYKTKLITFFATSFIWGLLLINRIGERISYLQTQQGTQNAVNVVNPIVSIPSAIGTYIKLFIWPVKLTLYQSEFKLSLPQFLVLFAISIVYFFMIIISYRKNKTVFFWLSFFIICLTTTLNPFGLSWLVAERYAYIGSIGLYFSFSLLIYKFIDSKKFQTIGYILFSVILIAFSVRTIIRNIDWQNEDNLWVATAKYSQSDPKIFNNLGDMYSRQGDLQKAADAFSHAIELNPRYPDAYHNLGNVIASSGNQEDAIKYYKKAIELNPGLWESYQSISVIKYNSGQYSEAQELMQKAIDINPTNSNLHLNLGLIYIKTKKFQKATNSLQKALQLDPENTKAKEILQKLDK